MPTWWFSNLAADFKKILKIFKNVKFLKIPGSAQTSPLEILIQLVWEDTDFGIFLKLPVILKCRQIWEYISLFPA